MPLLNPPIVIKADIREQKIIKRPIVTQNDSVILKLEILENGVPYDLTGATTVSLANKRKSDSVVVVTPGTFTGNIATFNLGTNELEKTGEVYAKAQFYDADDRVSTLTFSYMVEGDPTGAGYVPSVDEMTLIEAVMDDAQQKIDELSAVDVVALTTRVSDIAVNVKSFGAKGDGITDDTLAINTAAQYCFDNGFTLTARGDFKITNTVTLRCNVEMADATFKYNGVGTALIIGDTTTRTLDLKMTLPSVIQTSKTWGADVGVKLINIYTSRITVTYVSNFGTGLVLTSFGSNGTVYNTFTIGHLQNNKVNLLIQNGDVNAWVNENLFQGGRYSHLSTEGTTISGVCHIKTVGITGSTYQPNNNLFVKPSIEGDTPEYTLDIHGAFNTVLQGRYEGALTKKVIFRTIGGVGSRQNTLYQGYQLDTVEVTQEAGSQWNNISSTNRNVMEGSAISGIQTYKNTGSSNYPAVKILDTTQNPYDSAVTNYAFQQSANKSEFKRSIDNFNRMEINHGTGQILIGDGLAAPSKGFKYASSGFEIVGGLFLNGNAWDTNLLRLGSYRLWVDSTGKLRMKNTAPTSDTDGTIVGTQV